MSREIKYLLPDASSGKWNWTKEAENYNIAIPKTLDALQVRVDKVLSKIWKTIEKGVQANAQTSHHAAEKYTRKISQKTELAAEEFGVHLFMITDFQRKIEEILGDSQQGSPLMSLKKMDSPISKRKVNTFNYDRMDIAEISKKLEDVHLSLEHYHQSLPKIAQTWSEFLQLTDISTSPSSLIGEMKRLRIVLETLPVEYRDSLFGHDDVTKGVLKRGIRLRVNNTDLQTKLHNALLRSLLAGCLDYRHSAEKQTVEQIVFRLRELDLYSENHTLMITKSLLETEPKSVASATLCYKKIGELHQNLHQKLFLIDSLNFLRVSWSQELLIALDLFADSLGELHEKLLFATREGQELEVYIGVLQELLMQSQSGTEYFALNTKLHNKHLLLAAQYDHVDAEHLDKCLAAVADTRFLKLLASCEHFIHKLQAERVPERVEAGAFEKVGWAVGKTVMIDSYPKAVTEVLANLGTFISNTLHVLIGEILSNSSPDSPHREGLFHAYRVSEQTLARI